MSTKIPIYENPEIDIYTDCFDESALFIKIKKARNITVEAHNLKTENNNYCVIAESDIEIFKEVAQNFLRWYEKEKNINEYLCFRSKPPNCS
jgi:hypothetical protein